MQDHRFAQLASDLACLVDLLGPLRKYAPECSSFKVKSSTLFSVLFDWLSLLAAALFVPFVPLLIFWATPRVATLVFGWDDALAGAPGRDRLLWCVAAVPLIYFN